MEHATEKKTASKKSAFVSIGTFLVSLTYTFTDPALRIVFKCKMALDRDDKDARQAFYSQSDGDIEAGQFAYNVDMLSRIVNDEPEGLPGFDELQGELSDRIKTYFGTGEPILVKIAGDAVDMYNRVSQPVEFFR